MCGIGFFQAFSQLRSINVGFIVRHARTCLANLQNSSQAAIPHLRSLGLGHRSLDTVHSRAQCLGRLELVTGIRRLFLPHVGMRGSVQHLYEEFQNSLWERRIDYQEVRQERRESHQSRLHAIVQDARERREFLPNELASLRDVLYELLSEDSCAEWLGFNDLARPDTRPPLRRLAGLVREPDWTNAENIRKLRMYRAAAFVECLRPNVLDWETPRIPDMEWVLAFIEAFTRSAISVQDQINLIDDLSRPRVSLEAIVRTTRGPRLELSPSELRYVWETRHLSHEERAKAWDNRSPKPFWPLGGSNLEMYADEKRRDAWRVAVNRQLTKAKALYDPESGQDEREPN